MLRQLQDGPFCETRPFIPALTAAGPAGFRADSKHNTCGRKPCLSDPRSISRSPQRPVEISYRRRFPLGAPTFDDSAWTSTSRHHLALMMPTLALHWESAANDPDLILAPILLNAADLLVGGWHPKVRQCEGETCGWLFLDRSPSGRRRWCSMADCGNRAKVRKFYLQQERCGPRHAQRILPEPETSYRLPNVAPGQSSVRNGDAGKPSLLYRFPSGLSAQS